MNFWKKNHITLRSYELIKTEIWQHNFYGAVWLSRWSQCQISWSRSCCDLSKRRITLYVELHYSRSLQSFTSCVPCKGDKAEVARDWTLGPKTSLTMVSKASIEGKKVTSGLCCIIFFLPDLPCLLIPYIHQSHIVKYVIWSYWYLE